MIPCSGCDRSVYPVDPYYSSPCGTYCTPCMEQHIEGCDICGDEFSFDFEGEDYDDESDFDYEMNY